ncbi:hypothetical protein ACOSQ2_007223 [Xanthoceras sorbifolium]
MDLFEVLVQFGSNIVELGHYHSDHISRITLLHALLENQTGNSDPPKEEYIVCVQLPWCHERLEVNNDMEMLEVFEIFRVHRVRRIVFQVEPKLYIPDPPKDSSTTSNQNLVVPDDNHVVIGWGGDDNGDEIEVENEYQDDSGDDINIGCDSGDRMGLKNLFWEASRSSDVYGFRCAMEEIDKVNKDAKIWLEQTQPHHWSRHAFDPSIKCDHVTNNMTESFNSMLGDHRAKTYLCLLEYIRRMVMKRFQKRKEEYGHYCRANSMSERVIDFVDPILSKSAFMRTYTSMIHPIPDKCVWPDFHTQALIPPPLKTLPGRPKVSRRREPNEKPKESRSTCVVCTICKVPGHNKRTCKGSKVLIQFYS